MRRVSIADIMRETGLSRATIDRVLNGRGNVHQRTRDTVERTLARLSSPDAVELAPTPMADIALRLGRGMMARVKSAWDEAGASGSFHDLHMAREDDVLDATAALCRDTRRPLIITAKNTPRLVQLLSDARRKGKRVISFISDLAPEARDHFVGIDDRAAGQTAAFLIGRALGDRPTSVGVVVGDVAFTCHEDREIGFRTGLRAHFPKVVLSGEAQGEDSADLTRDAVLRLLGEQPALGALYNVGGGNAGLTDAIREAGRQDDMLVICHEVNHVTEPLLREGWLDYAIAANPKLLLNAALRLAAGETLDTPAGAARLDFGVYTRFNLPLFS